MERHRLQIDFNSNADHALGAKHILDDVVRTWERHAPMTNFVVTLTLAIEDAPT